MLTKNQIKQIKSLQLKKNRISESQFIVEGDKIVKELLSSKMSIKCIYATQKWIDLNNSILGSFDYKVLTIHELEIMSNLKLSEPKMMDVAVPANIKGINLKEFSKSIK